MSRVPGLLVLEHPDHPEGLIFEGTLFGAQPELPGESKSDRGFGEVVFNTSMTGYQEILTDPSYYGQVVCMTVAHIGNTGVNDEDVESARPRCSGFVVHDLCETPSNWRANDSLDHYLQKNAIPAIKDIDTRALTRELRTRGVARGMIIPASERGRIKDLLKKLPSFEGRDLIAEVTTPEAYVWSKKQAAPVKSSKSYKVVAVDFGIKYNLLRKLDESGCDVEVVPAKTSAQEILKRKPDGVFLSNGPGDPSAASYASQMIAQILGQVPIFGVCMGHQLLSIAVGAKTYKLKFGHRGGNQPVKDLLTGKVEISSHNHGYSVDDATLPKMAEVTHINLNDHTVEGIHIPSKRAFSVQYHPEAAPGPHDSDPLFKRFIDLMKG